MPNAHDHDLHDHDRGLADDVTTLLGRRRALRLLGGAGLVAVASACSSGSQTADSSSTSSTAGATATTTASAAAVASGAEIPDETAGPYPGDGSNGPNVLAESGIVRSDIRSSFGSSTTVAEGVDLTIRLTVVESDTGAALAGTAVYLWHCNIDGAYSMYSQGVEDENYLRGVQEADADGLVTFRSIFPGAYSGRWPHMHFEVYGSLDDATAAGEPVKTSQLALPEDVCDVVYGTSGYEQSVRNLAQSSLGSDNVFSDGYDEQLATVTGSVDDGYVATLVVRV